MHTFIVRKEGEPGFKAMPIGHTRDTVPHAYNVCKGQHHVCFAIACVHTKR